MAKWISAAEAKPQEGERVLATIGRSVYEVCWTGSCWFRFGVDVEVIFGAPVTAWQPLPKAAKEVRA